MAKTTRNPAGDPPSLAEQLVPVGDERITVPEFLRRTADHLEGATTHEAGDPAGAGGPARAEDLARLADVFLGAGVPALREAHRCPGWVEFRVSVAEDRRRDWYAALLGEVRALRDSGDVANFFFVHKQPGFRIRFEVGSRKREPVALRLRRWLAERRAEGVVTEWGPAVYEPEQHLFGGPASMRSVHRLFTADSLVWLEYHSADSPAGPSWALALLQLKSLFGELQVHDYEDRDIWDRLRGQAHRRFPAGEPKDWTRISHDLRRLWHSPEALHPLVGPVSLALTEEFRRLAHEECEVWRRQHFLASGATVGVREAAAFFTVFLWNRARVSLDVQIATSEALVLGPPYSMKEES
ncbi:thiopeptide-type bacteriocin biosynthesis protein [Streptomyces bacillaris]